MLEQAATRRTGGVALLGLRSAKPRLVWPTCVNSSTAAPVSSTMHISNRWPRVRCSALFGSHRLTPNRCLMRLFRVPRVYVEPFLASSIYATTIACEL